MSNEIDIAVRAWAVPKLQKNKRSRSTKRVAATKRTVGAKRRAPFEPEFVLIFDTETRTDAAQALTFGCWRFCRVTTDGLVILDEGLLYADELPNEDPVGFKILCSYVEDHRATTDRDRPISFKSRSQFVEDVLYTGGYEARARIVGFNLPYDLSRLSIGWTEGRGANYGGFSFILWSGAEGTAYKERRHRPRITIKNLDNKGAFISFTRPLEPEGDDLIPVGSEDGKPDAEFVWRGSFVDCGTLGFALSGESGSLARMCEVFDVPGKDDVEEHGTITPKYIDYCRQDVAATQGLYEALIAELHRHPVDLPPERAYSPASLAKAYLAAMGIVPIRDRLTDFPVEVLGYAMTAFYGGRAECRIRLWSPLVQLLDFTSMYPTVGALMDLHRLQLAGRIEVEECTDELAELLAEVTLEVCFDAALWPKLVGFALVAPEHDVLPVRARYDGRTFGIGVNPLECPEALWYSFADCVAATLLTGRPPRILRAVRLVPSRGRVRRLRAVKVRGEVEVDPSERDPMVVMVEERQRHKRRDETAEDRRLADALKIVANSGSYGIYSEFNPREHRAGERTPVEVFGRARPFVDRVSSPEDPGRYCFPPFAACITGAARLMLAMLERCLTDRHGSWAFCDTDSMAPVVAESATLVQLPGGSGLLSDGQAAVRALSFDDVSAIRERFNALNPYDRSVVPDLLKLESTATCLAISAKRYALHDLGEDGEPRFLKDQMPSEHGLGQLLSPDGSGPKKHWIPVIWRILIRQFHGFETDLPTWIDRPTMVKTVVSSIWVAKAFATYNMDRPYREQVKPFNFVMTAAGAKPPAGVPIGTRFRLVAPFVDGPAKWLGLAYVNVHDPDEGPYRLTTRDGRPGLARVDTFRDVLSTYGAHPETKSLSPDGSSCGPGAVGLLRRRPVKAGVIRLIGKESNRLEERRSGELTADDLDQRLTIYEDHDEWFRSHLPKLQRLEVVTVARVLKMSERRTRDLLKGRSLPHSAHRATLEALLRDLD